MQCNAMQCNAMQCKTRQAKNTASHRAEEKTMVFRNGVEERIEIALVTDTHLLTLLDFARFNENAESRTARRALIVRHILRFVFHYEMSYVDETKRRGIYIEIEKHRVGDEVELFEVSNYGKEEAEMVTETVVHCLVITLISETVHREVLNSWLLDRCVLEAFREGFRGNNLTRFQATASKTVKPRIIAVENAEPGGNARPKSCLRAPRVPRNEVAADNDTILCIGYSAHIRGRILHVDLSLSSLLGMHRIWELASNSVNTLIISERKERKKIANAVSVSNFIK
ncbi:hypothetical protein V1477_001298 [Vespula maculifrons]|uniref:Uncharacterized protein n=1 Tax=Vespula maculifrons TaxID=7453 RepID=A0ABD2CZE1_VESMC